MNNACRVMLAALTAILVNGCGGTDPRRLDAEFALATVAGNPLPAVALEGDVVVD